MVERENNTWLPDLTVVGGGGGLYVSRVCGVQLSRVIFNQSQRAPSVTPMRRLVIAVAARGRPIALA